MILFKILEDLLRCAVNDAGVDRVWSHSFAGGLPP